MNTPPHSPFYSSHSPYGSSFGIHTPNTGSSFDSFSIRSGSSRRSDNSLLRTHTAQPKIETREPSLVDGTRSSSSRPSVARSQTTPVIMSSISNRDYLHFKFRKVGAKWNDEISVEEIPAPESQIKKLAESRNKQGSALQQLRKMGAGRQDRVNEQTKILNDMEKDGSSWEPVFIHNTKLKTRIKENVMEVKEFEIIFARKEPLKVPRRGDASSQPPKAQADVPKAEAKEDRAKKEKRKSRDRKPEAPSARGGLMDDPFGATDWFNVASGAALGNHGPATTGAPGLPPSIPPERPIGTVNVTPRILTVGADILGNPIFGTEVPPSPIGATGRAADTSRADDLLESLHSPHEDDIIPVQDEIPHKQSSHRQSRERYWKHETRAKSRSRSRSRRRQQRPSPHSVRFQDAEHRPPGSSGSSVSGDTTSMFDEVDELSSYTSEETRGSSPGSKQPRIVKPAARQHTPGPQSYEVFVSGQGRRRNPRATEQGQHQTPRGLEQSQLLTRRNTSSKLKPIVTQTTPPVIAPTNVPPTAEYPDFYEKQDRQHAEREREREPEHRIDEYIRDSIRDRELKERERSLDRKERAMKELQDQQDRQRETAKLREELEKVRLDREFGPSRQTVYTHEPRNR